MSGNPRYLEILIELQITMDSGVMGEVLNRNQGLESCPVSSMSLIDFGDCRPLFIKLFLRTMLPTPREIFASFEKGELEREELHALMALHARELIQEMEEDYQNPAAAWFESLLARRASNRLVKLHGGRVIREILTALADVPDFPPARYLWNAGHPDVPLHCFLRMRREPVFRILSVSANSGEFRVSVEYGNAAKGKATRQILQLKRDEQWKLKARVI